MRNIVIETVLIDPSRNHFPLVFPLVFAFPYPENVFSPYPLLLLNSLFILGDPTEMASL